MRTIISLTGASGSSFGVDFIKNCPGEKILIVSQWGRSVLHQETGLSVEDLSPYVTRVYSDKDLNAPFASGSNPFDQYVIIPCSVTTLGRIASGIGENLTSRIGEIALKENRKMVLCIRETPLSAVALENALKLSKLGVTIMPLSPQFYMGSETVQDLARHFSNHLLTHLNLSQTPAGWRSAELS